MAVLRQRLSTALRPVYQAYWRVRRPMTLGARVIALNADRHVMLVRHSYWPGWHLPGGGVEPRETVETAARRELAEEAGLEPDGPLALHGVYANHAHFPNDHIVVFIAAAVRACASDSAGEIVERGFFGVEALPEGVTAGTRRRLDELFSGAPRSPDW